ncbi:uncharacterized protein LOC128195232 [Vigna angularis]|uniref:uncharacterized protein LOC128195232 n=1 Tax=Phaseolus angularis TaxID=3914 RepID=UPI0022B358E5|nr:uncharacterized protein LOC128195232 [Vigna angularis]
MLYQQQFQSMRPVPSPIEEHVIPPPPTGRSAKGSCSASAIPEDDMDDGSPCLLYILEDTEMVLVARGTEFRSATVCHGMQLLEDEVKVSVDEMIIPDASVPLSTEEIFTVEQAYKSFISWPKFLVKPVSDPSTQAQEKIPLSEDDPLSSLHLLADILDDKPLEVEYDANVFGQGSKHTSDPVTVVLRLCHLRRQLSVMEGVAASTSQPPSSSLLGQYPPPRAPAPTFPTRQQERSQPARKVVVVLQHQTLADGRPSPPHAVAAKPRKEGARPLV